MRKYTPMKVIFLDIDGVLNSYDGWRTVVYRIGDRFGLVPFLRRHLDIFGIHTYRVYLLSRIIRKTDAKVVLTGTIRHSWDTKDPKVLQLKEQFRRFGISVIGLTSSIPKDSYHSHRGAEIHQWLAYHNVYRYVILDDETADLKDFEGKTLIQTITRTRFGEREYRHTGLSRRHVDMAIRILNLGDTRRGK